MNRKLAAQLRSQGVAHLYVGIAKADGVVSTAERVRAPYYARKSQEVMDVMGMGGEVKEQIKGHIADVLADSQCGSWSPEQHLDQAMVLLKEAKQEGDWGAELTGVQNADGLEQVARLDGYIMKESAFLQAIKERLKELK